MREIDLMSALKACTKHNDCPYQLAPNCNLNYYQNNPLPME